MTETKEHQRTLVEFFPTIGSLCIIGIGVAVLAGWAFSIDALKKIVPTWTFMAPNTAVMLILLGVVLVILEAKHTSGLLHRLASLILWFALSIEFMTLSEYLFGWNLGIDNVLFHDAVASYGAAYPGRMAPPTVICLTLLTLSLMQLRSRLSWRISIAIFFSLASCLFIGLQLLIFVYDSSTFNFTSTFNPMAAHTAIAISIFSIGILLTQPSRRVIRSMLGTGVGSAMVRRVLPAAILIPIAAGWVGFQVEITETANPIVIVALGVTLTIGGLIILSGISAWLINRMEIALKRSEERYRLIVETAHEGIWMIDTEARTTFVNKALTEILACPAEEILGQSVFLFMDDETQTSVAEALERRRNGIIERYEVRIRRKDGIYRWTSVSASPLFDDNRQYTGAIALISDITERKQAEQGLIDSEARFRTVIESAPMGIAFSRSEIVLYENSKFLQMFGYESAEEVNGCPVYQHIAPQSHEMIQERARRRARGEAVPFNYEAIGLRKDGSQFPLEIWLARVEFPDGPAAIVFHSDVSERKRAEDALKLSEERYRSLIDTQSEVIARSDIQGNLTFVNDNYCQAFGKSREELLGKSFTPNALPEDLPTTLTMLEGIQSPPYRKQIETRHLTPMGVRWFSWDNAAVVDDHGTIIEFQGVGRDITERKQSEDSLRESEQRYRQLVENIPAGLIVNNPDTRMTFVNRRAGSILKRNPDEMPGGTITETTSVYVRGDGSSLPISEHPVNQVLTSGEAVEDFELGINHPDLTERLWILVNTFPVYNEQHKIYQVVSVFTDITQRKWAEVALRESEARFRSTFEQAAVGIAHVSPEGKFLSINQKFCDLVGYKHDEMLTKTFQEITHPDDLEQDLEHVYQILAREIETYSVEKRYYRKDQTIQWAQLTVSICWNDDGAPQYFIAVVEDIADRKQAEAELQRAHDELEQKVVRRTAQLQAAKEYVEAILNNSVDGILLTNRDFTIQQTNPAFDRLFACEPNSYVNLSLTTILDKDSDGLTINTIQESLVDRKDLYITVRARRQDGTVFDAELGIGYSNLEGVVCVIRDITERKQAERTIAEERNLLRTLIDAVPHSIYVKDTQHRFLLTNRACYQPFEYDDVNAHFGKTDRDFFPPELAEKFMADERRLFETGMAQVNMEEQSLWPHGQDTWLLTTKVPLYTVDGELRGLVGLSQDITERKQTERTIAEDRNLLRTLIDAVPHSIYVKDTQHRFLLTNATTNFYLGHDSSAPVIGKTDADFFPSEFAEKYMADERHLFETETALVDIEEQSLRRDGQSIWLLTTKVPLYTVNGELRGLVGLTQSIAERKQAEANLEFRNLTLTSLYTGSLEIGSELDVSALLPRIMRRAVELLNAQRGGGIYLYDADRGVLRLEAGTGINEHRIGITLRPGEGVAGRVLQTGQPLIVNDYAQWEGRAAILVNNPSSAVMGVPLFIQGQAVGALLVFANSQERTFSSDDINLAEMFAAQAAEALRNAQLYSAAQREIAERKLTEASQARERQLMNALMDSIPDAIYFKDRDSRFIRLNQGSASMVGAGHPEQAIGKTDFDFFTLDNAETAFNDEQMIIRTGSSLVNQEAMLTWPDREAAWVSTTKMPLYDVAGQIIGTFGVSRDITGLKLAEEALRQALAQEKELGELKTRFVSMASHEFRTPLATILAFTESLRVYRHRLSDEQIEKKLSNIQGQVAHLTAIMEDVLLLGRMQAKRVDFNPTRANMDELCRSVLNEFENRPDVRHTLHYSCDDGSWEVLLDQKLMRQIMSNLLSNAIKYSPEDKPVRLSLRYTDETCVFTVSDYGIGIPEADLKHLFEPFNRASNVGTISGTGLGLVIVKEAVDLHGGTISVETQIGVGSTFIVRIPTAFIGELADGENSRN